MDRGAGIEARAHKSVALAATHLRDNAREELICGGIDVVDSNAGESLYERRQNHFHRAE